MSYYSASKAIWEQLSYGKSGVATFVRGAIVQGDNCPRVGYPRRQLSKETIVQGGLLSKVTVVQGDYCPRRQLHYLLSKEEGWRSYWIVGERAITTLSDLSHHPTTRPPVRGPSAPYFPSWPNLTYYSWASNSSLDKNTCICLPWTKVFLGQKSSLDKSLLGQLFLGQ